MSNVKDMKGDVLKMAELMKQGKSFNEIADATLGSDAVEIARKSGLWPESVEGIHDKPVISFINKVLSKPV